MEPAHFNFWPENLPRSITRPRTSLHYNLEVSAQRYPDRAMVVYYGSELSYAAAEQQVGALAGFLQQRCAVRRGDRVMLFMQNCPQFIIGFYAILRAGAMVVPVNPMNLVDELRHQATDCEARVILCGQEVFPTVRGLLGEGLFTHAILARYGDYVQSPTDIPLPDSVSAAAVDPDQPGATRWAEALAYRLTPRVCDVGPGDLCVMPYTSGTTGRPKGCMHSHETVMSTTVIGNAWMGAAGPDATLLCTLPLFHVTGMQSGMNQPIFCGATVILMTRWDRTVAARLIERYRVQGWTNITTMAIDFLANPDLPRYDLSSLRRIAGGGAAMPAAVAQRLKDHLALDYIEGYGLSETIAPTHINPPQRPKRQCLGIPICDTDSRIIDPATAAELAPGEVGEIVSSGPQIFLGYWRNAEATAQAFLELDGKRFFRTGDLGRIDEDGYFFIVDRLKRMINASGFKVWPAEVEAVLYGNPDVQEACIIATQDARRGETVKAVVVLRPERRGQVRDEDITEWCRGHMAAYKVPRVVEFVETLPRSATGKVQWRLLQEREHPRSGPA